MIENLVTVEMRGLLYIMHNIKLENSTNRIAMKPTAAQGLKVKVLPIKLSSRFF